MAIMRPKHILSKQENVSKENNEKQLTAFIEQAPDGKKTRKSKGRKIGISHTIAPEDLAALDELAESLGLSRAGVINALIKKAIKKQEI